MIQNRIVEEYEKERELSKSPDYVSRYEDDYDDVFVGSDFEEVRIDSKQEKSQPRIDAPPSKGDRERSRDTAEPTTSSSQQPPKTPHSTKSKKRKTFGAGILDDGARDE